MTQWYNDPWPMTKRPVTHHALLMVTHMTYYPLDHDALTDRPHDPLTHWPSSALRAYRDGVPTAPLVVQTAVHWRWFSVVARDVVRWPDTDNRSPLHQDRAVAVPHQRRHLTAWSLHPSHCSAFHTASMTSSPEDFTVYTIQVTKYLLKCNR